MSSTTFSSFQFTAPGPDFQHEIIQVPKPTPKDGEVLIKNKAVAINPLDAKRIAYNLMIDNWPVGGGFEVSGVVDAVGAGVTHVKEGEEVFAVVGPTFNPTFGFQEYTLVPGGGVVSKPEKLSAQEAASLPIGYFAAAATLHFGIGTSMPFLASASAPTNKDMRTVLILGGASAVGSAAIQLLRRFAPSTKILATSSSKHFDHVKSLGTDQVFDYNSSGMFSDIAKAVPSGVNGIVDVIGTSATNTAEYMKLFGAAEHKMFAMLTTGPEIAKEDVPEDVTFNMTTMGQIMMKGLAANVMRDLRDAVEEGAYKVPLEIEIVGTGLAAIVGGLKMSLKGVSGKKLMVLF